jgi:hypothetical protein
LGSGQNIFELKDFNYLTLQNETGGNSVCPRHIEKYFIYLIESDSSMKAARTNFFIILIVLGLILVPSIAIISFSQSNETSSDIVSNDTSNDDTFSSLSRELANQSDGDD